MSKLSSDSLHRPQKPGLIGMWPWLLALTAVWVAHLGIETAVNPYVFSIIMYAGINVILAVSLNLVNGFTGQFSIGHAGFMAVGGYVSAAVVTVLIHHFPTLPDGALGSGALLLSGLIAAGFVAAGVGYLVGMPSLRLRGDYLAIVTLGFGEIIRVVLLNIDHVSIAGAEIDLGGARGMPGIPQLTSFGWVYTFVVITIFCVWRLIRSAHGRVLLAIREDEVAGDAMGVNTTQGKVRAFAMGAFFAGIGGGLFAHYLRFLVPTMFDFNRSFEFVIMVVLGGMGSISGSVVAAVFLTVLKESLRPLAELTQIDFRMVIYSSVLIILMLTRPNGIFGSTEIDSLLRRLKLSRAGARNGK
jgi:branched-chain amino acid transport system permease protein